MILVHAPVHRAGQNFPEIQYDDLLETEGFGKMTHDFGVTPQGLPNLEIRHAKIQPYTYCKLICMEWPLKIRYSSANHP